MKVFIFHSALWVFFKVRTVFLQNFVIHSFYNSIATECIYFAECLLNVLRLLNHLLMQDTYFTVRNMIAVGTDFKSV